jgi:hypothetical protein
VKTVATFWKPEEAHLLRLRLGEAGIPAFLQDEQSTQLHPWRAAAIGGVRVQVAEADFDAAKLLASGLKPESAPKAMPPDPDAIECCCCGALMASGQSRCSACGWSYEDEGPAGGRPGLGRANV